MSRRASLYAKKNPEEKKPKGVRFPDELVFLDNIKENDIGALDHMLRRASLQVDISGINDAGRCHCDWHAALKQRRISSDIKYQGRCNVDVETSSQAKGTESTLFLTYVRNKVDYWRRWH